MKGSINLLDASFNKDLLNNYQLSIQLFEYNMTVCVTDIKQQVSIALWSLDAKYSILEYDNLLDELLNNCTIPLKGTYKSTTVSIANSQYSFVPSPLFDSSQLQSYIELNCGPQNDCQFMSDSIEPENMHIAYSVPNKIIKSLGKAINDYRFIHHKKLFLNSITSDFKSNDTELYVHYKNKQLGLLYFKESKFHHGNNYNIDAPEDFLFFVLNSCKQLKLNPQKLKLILLGGIKTGDEIHHLAFSYFDKIQFGVVHKKTIVASGLNDVPKHLFYTAYKQHLCA
jgi:hypothetical protein